MAADIARTVTEDLTDTAADIAAIERELVNVRAHLARATADASPGNTAGLRRAVAVLSGVAAQAARHAGEAHHRAVTADQSRAVS